MGKGIRSILIFFVLSTALSGCTFIDEDRADFDLNVELSTTNGTIIERYLDGELQLLDNVVIYANFSKINPELQVIGYILEGETVEFEISETEQNHSISIEFNSHGKYDLQIFGISSNDVRKSATFQVSINLEIEWYEESTSQPKPLPFNPIPQNGGEHPAMIDIISEVTNPSVFDDLSGGQSVQFSWTITDELGDTCQETSAEVEDGESEIWETIYFNTYLEHELGVVYDEGQDLININHTVTIAYES